MPVYVVYNHLPQCAAACIARQDDLSTAIAKVMEHGAKAAVAVRTGALRSGIELHHGNPASVSASSMAGGALREYSHYQEYGTRYMGAQPFMMPGFVMGVASVPVKGRSDFGVYIEAAA